MQLVYSGNSHISTWFRSSDLDTLIERRLKSKRKKIETPILYIAGYLAIRIFFNFSRFDIVALIVFCLVALIIIPSIIHDQRFIMLAKKDLDSGTKEITGIVDKKGIVHYMERWRSLFKGSLCAYPTSYYIFLKDNPGLFFTATVFRKYGRDGATVTLTYYPHLRFVKEYSILS